MKEILMNGQHLARRCSDMSGHHDDSLIVTA